MAKHVYVSSGFSLGSVLAGLMSWTVNKSVGWTVLHILYGWLYVFYAACAHNSELTEALKAAGL